MNTFGLALAGVVGALVVSRTGGTTALVGAFGSGVSRLAQAIAKAEGYGTPNSIPTRANNPGNLKNGAPVLAGTSITKYATAAEGWAALERQIGLILTGKSAYYKATDTIAQMGSVWAPSGDNNITGAWARNVANFLNVSVSTRIGAVV